MQKIKTQRQDFQFYSEKNKRIFIAHSLEAKKFADMLEEDKTVLSYQVCVPIDPQKLLKVSMVDIRKEYKPELNATEPMWETDFLIEYATGKKAVRELSKDELLEKRAELEKLELSRRYWKSQGITDWKIVLFQKKEDAK